MRANILIVGVCVMWLASVAAWLMAAVVKGGFRGGLAVSITRAVLLVACVSLGFDPDPRPSEIERG
ncbi:hypothetical protein [Acrocarpospora sp. B8E8]|uniref:hypothetical protein n=1 Tax=Acrocarpospora sp. B8E8 TaxID=3153572 RepID=UPI00325DADFD